MIQPLRRRHRRVSLVLALVLPPLAFLAWSSRPGPPRQEELPAALADPAAARSSGDWVPLEGGAGIRARARFSPDSRQVEIEASGPLASPDVLAYWAAGEADGPARPGEGSWLLGAFDGHRPRLLEVPPEMPGGDGWLILYSLAHDEVVASAGMVLPSPPGG